MFGSLFHHDAQLSLGVDLLPRVRIWQACSLRATCLDHVHAAIDVDIDESPQILVTVDAVEQLGQVRTVVTPESSARFARSIVSRCV